MRLKPLEGQDKLNQDYENYNLAIKQKAELEKKLIQEALNALKEKAYKVAEALTNDATVSEKGS